MTINLIDARRGLHDRCLELFADKNIAEKIYRYLCDGIEDCEEAEPIKHGRWIKITQEWADYAEYFCSCCGRKIKAPFTLNPAWAFPYCHCGAKMDEQQEVGE